MSDRLSRDEKNVLWAFTLQGGNVEQIAQQLRMTPERVRGLQASSGKTFSEDDSSILEPKPGKHPPP